MIPLYKPFIPPDLFVILQEVIDSGYIAMGDYVEKFEQRFGDFIDYPPVVATNSCTSALQIALRLADVGPGCEVISTPVTAAPTNVAIYNTGARIVWADVNPHTGNIDWDDAIGKITPFTEAIVFVDYMGRPAHDYKMYNIPPCVWLIEDAAHALGASWDGRMVGSLVDMTVFSFQAIKHLTTGDGGMLAVSSGLDRARRLRWFGLDREAGQMESDIVEAGWKANMNNLSAAMGILGLRYLPDNLARCRENYDYYQMEMGPSWDYEYDYNDHWETESPWTYTLLCNDREKVEKRLTAAGIGHSRGHRRNDEYAIFAESRVDLPGVDEYTSKCLHIPCGWWVTDEDRERIVNVISS